MELATTVTENAHYKIQSVNIVYYDIFIIFLDPLQPPLQGPSPLICFKLSKNFNSFFYKLNLLLSTINLCFILYDFL